MARKEKPITFEEAVKIFINPDPHNRKGINFENQTVITQNQLERICEEYNKQIINKNNQKRGK